MECRIGQVNYKFTLDSCFLAFRCWSNHHSALEYAAASGMEALTTLSSLPLAPALALARVGAGGCACTAPKQIFLGHVKWKRDRAVRTRPSTSRNGLANRAYFTPKHTSTFIYTVILCTYVQQATKGASQHMSINHICWASCSCRQPPVSDLLEQPRVKALRKRHLPTTSWQIVAIPPFVQHHPPTLSSPTMRQTTVTPDAVPRRSVLD